MAGSEDVFGQKDDDLDLYDDFIVSKGDQNYVAPVNHKQCIEDLKRENENLKLRINSLEQESEASKVLNFALKRNISVLYKTAKQEIEAKNTLLRDLQTRYDSLVFRRSKRGVVPFRSSANSSLSSSADLPPCLPDAAVEEFTKSNRPALSCYDTSPKNHHSSPSSRSEHAPTYSGHQNPNKFIYRKKVIDFPVNRRRIIQTPVQKPSISDDKCESVSCLTNVLTKDSNLDEKINLIEEDKAKDQLNVELNGVVLNSISLDSLRKITKLCDSSNPLNSARLVTPSNGGITDAERVLAHRKGKAKTSVIQNDMKHNLNPATCTLVSHKCDDSIAGLQESKNDHKSTPGAKKEHLPHLNHISNHHLLTHHGASYHKQNNGEIFSKSSKNLGSSGTNCYNIKTQSACKMDDLSLLYRSSKKDVGLSDLVVNSDNSFVLPDECNLESKMGISDKTMANLCNRDESSSLEEDVPKSCQLEVEEQQNVVTNLLGICDNTKANLCNSDVSCSLEEDVPKNCQIEVDEQQHVMTNLIKPDGMVTDTFSKNVQPAEPITVQELRNKPCISEHSEENVLFVKADGSSSIQQNIESRECLRNKTIEKVSEKSSHLNSPNKNKRSRKCNRESSHAQIKTNGYANSSHDDLLASSSRLIKRSERSFRSSVSPRKKSHAEKPRHIKQRIEKSHLDDRDLKGKCRQSSSLSMRDNSSKYNGEHVKKSLNFNSSSSRKVKKHSPKPTKSHAARLHPRKSSKTHTGVRQEKCTLDSYIQETTSRKRNFVDLDSLFKKKSEAKKIHLKRNYKSISELALPSEKKSSMMSSDIELEEGEEQEKCSTRDSYIQKSTSRKRNFVDSDSLSKKKSEAKKMHLKRNYKCISELTLPSEKQSPMISSDIELEEGEKCSTRDSYIQESTSRKRNFVDSDSLSKKKSEAKKMRNYKYISELTLPSEKKSSKISSDIELEEGEILSDEES